MKGISISLALLLVLGGFSACTDELDVVNPNQQTSGSFGYSVDELEESVIAAYNHTRMEGSYGRVGYNIDVCRGEEAWVSSQVWYLPFDDLNVPMTDEIVSWPWREWYYTINVTNFILSRTTGDNATMDAKMKHIKGQALFLRGLSYYNLAGYYQDVPLITDYNSYGTLDGLYCSNNTYDEVLDFVEADFKEAMELLPSRDAGGEWSGGRATCGSAAGYYARTLMQRHKFTEALKVLEDIIGGSYGSYKLMANYGDNFREGSAYEYNAESLFEIGLLDYGKQGTVDEWTPVNTSSDASQGHALESNYAPGSRGGWADISASPWLYNLFKGEKTTAGKLDPRLYWTIGTYESDWEGFEYGNMCFGEPQTAAAPVFTNSNNGGLPIAKNTNFRTGLYSTIVCGLRCGINLRMMRYSDVLLRAAECENEINGVTAKAIGYINQVRQRAGLKDLAVSDFGSADELFEQIANVERPKEFGCEYGRGLDLIRWGFFYDKGRMQQLKEHGTFRMILGAEVTDASLKAPVAYSEKADDTKVKSSFDTYNPGHEFLPIYLPNLNANPNLRGNSANDNIDNGEYFRGKGWNVRPVVSLKK